MQAVSQGSFFPEFSANAGVAPHETGMKGSHRAQAEFVRFCNSFCEPVSSVSSSLSTYHPLSNVFEVSVFSGSQPNYVLIEGVTIVQHRTFNTDF